MGKNICILNDLIQVSRKDSIRIVSSAITKGNYLDLIDSHAFSKDPIYGFKQELNLHLLNSQNIKFFSKSQNYFPANSRTNSEYLFK
jgi:hypothetical protein